MARYDCSVCGYTYDEAKEGRAWADLPEGWKCPRCGAAKSAFRPVDEAAGVAVTRSSAAVQAHRVFGYVFLALYVVMLWQMVPRLFSYQIEFPARTVVHISLGMAIGGLLAVKILIVRFFRGLDAAMAPLLGTSILVSSVVLIGISAPFALHEAFIERAEAAGPFAPDSLERVRTLLRQAGLDEAEAATLATAESLRAGQNVLRGKCTECHDLRTVLAKPRTPENWIQTVRRMAERTTLANALGEQEQRQVTAYLVAISPQLQRSAQEMRDEEEKGNKAKAAMQAVTDEGAPAAAFDLERARGLFQMKCSKCHSPKFVEASPPTSPDEARELVARMVEQGLTGSEDELAQIVRYLIVTHAGAQEN